MRNPILLTAILLGLTLSAKADPISVSPELKSFLMRPEQQQAVNGMLAQQWRALVGNCSSPHLQPTTVLIDNSPAFDQAGAPASGQWRVRDYVEGCGETRILNILFLFTPNGKMRRIALLPGTTIADARLQQDALMYAEMGMQNLMPSLDCKDIQYTNTSFVAFGEANPQVPPGRDNRSWTEEWTVRACGVTGIVTMHFIPDATGTTISSGVGEARRVSP